MSTPPGDRLRRIPFPYSFQGTGSGREGDGKRVASTEESLEFYAPDGNIAGSFRVEITHAPTNPAYTEVTIIPEDMESFQRFLTQFRNKPVTAKIPSRGSHIIVPGRDMQYDGVLRLTGH